MIGVDEKNLFKQKFIDRVRHARYSAGKTQEEIADAMGIKQDQYKHWETERVIPQHLIVKFCLACQVDLVWLLTGKGHMKSIEAAEIQRVLDNAPPWKRAKIVNFVKFLDRELDDKQ